MRVLNEDCVSPEPWTRHLYWLMPRRWPWLVGGPDANLILTYPLWCFAAVGLIWGFMLTVVGIEILNGGLVGAIHNGSLMLFMTRGGPTAHLLEGRLTGQAARDAWATIITHAVYVSPVFSLWGAFKVFNGSPYD